MTSRVLASMIAAYPSERPIASCVPSGLNVIFVKDAFRRPAVASNSTGVTAPV